MTRTLSDIANTAMMADPFFTANTNRDRLWFHDMLHGILNLRPDSACSEFEVSIYQAVLLRDKSVSTRHIPLADGGQDVLLNDIYQHILPGVEAFLQSLAQARGHQVRYRLNNDEIRTAYQRACILNNLIVNEFGCYLGEIEPGTLRQIPAERLTKLIEQSEDFWWIHFSPFEHAAYEGYTKPVRVPA